MHLNLLGPKSGAERRACKPRVLKTSGGLEDVYVAVKHVSLLLSDYSYSHFCWKVLNKKQFKNFSFCITYLSAKKA